jgi:hypothetical protein
MGSDVGIFMRSGGNHPGEMKTCRSTFDGAHLIGRRTVVGMGMGLIVGARIDPRLRRKSERELSETWAKKAKRRLCPMMHL